MNEKTLQEQLDEVNAKLSAEKDLGSQKDAEKIAVLEQQQADILKAIMDATQATALADQEQAIQLKIESETREVEYFLDNLEFDGVGMRELFVNEERYQLGRIVVQGKLIEFIEKYNDQIKIIQIENNQLQRQYDSLSSEYDKLVIEIGQVGNKLSEAIARAEDAESKRDAAVAKADGMEILVQEKQAQIDILRTENAVGAVNAPYVVDLEARREEARAIAESIKASRIKVYDVTPDNVINPKNYTAKRVDNDEEVTYNWTQEKKYEVMDTEQVLQFRNEHAQENNLPDLTLVNPVISEVVAPDITVTAEQFRSGMDSAQEDENVSQMDSGGAEVSGYAQGMAPSAQLENRIAALEADVKALKLRNGMVA